MRVLIGLAALSAFALAPFAAGAATLSYSQFFPGGNSLDPSQNPQSFALTDWDGTTQSVTLPQFDPARGTLTGVNLLLYGNLVTSGTLTNNGPTTIDVGNYTALLNLTVQAPGADPLTVSPALFSFTDTSVDPGGSLTFGGGTPVNANDTGSASITDFAPYVGTGSVVFPLSTVTDLNADLTGGNLDIDQTTRARAEVTITYAYDVVAAVPVPEPGSAALLGAGLLGLGLLRRRS